MEYKYPLRMRSKVSGAVVDFTSLTSGIVVDPGRSSGYNVGDVATNLFAHTHNRWEPVESKKVKLHNLVSTFRNS